jgi:competence protein ComEA
MVHVTGAVQSPGVYELRVGDRVAEALRVAGGTTDEADHAAINLAQRVHDEQRLDIPARAYPHPQADGAPTNPHPQPLPRSAGEGRDAGARASLPATPSTSSGAGEGRDAEFDALVVSPTNPEGGARINVNQATVAQLEKLPGIGVVSAKKIAAWRTDNGSIRAVADLRAAGLTAAVLRKALPYLALG